MEFSTSNRLHNMQHRASSILSKVILSKYTLSMVCKAHIIYIYYFCIYRNNQCCHTASSSTDRFCMGDWKTSPLAGGILNALETKENGGSINEVANKLRSTQTEWGLIIYVFDKKLFICCWWQMHAGYICRQTSLEHSSDWQCSHPNGSITSPFSILLICCWARFRIISKTRIVGWQKHPNSSHLLLIGV